MAKTLRRRIVGVVLAGGSSRRMGRDKAEILWNGQRLLDRAASTLARVCDEVLVADRGQHRLGAGRSVTDGAGTGPAAGLLGAARAQPGCDLMALACDLPLVPVGLLEELATTMVGFHWAVPQWRAGLEPLVALYRPAAIAALERRVHAGNFSLRGLANESELQIRFVDESTLRRWGQPERIFLNLNRPEDLALLTGLGTETKAALRGKTSEG